MAWFSVPKLGPNTPQNWRGKLDRTTYGIDGTLSRGEVECLEGVRLSQEVVQVVDVIT